MQLRIKLGTDYKPVVRDYNEEMDEFATLVELFMDEVPNYDIYAPL